MSWEQRARRVRRRKQRRVAAAAVTLAGGQLAWMVTRGASPVEALEASRSTGLVSNIGCGLGSDTCIAAGGVTDVAVSDDGQYVAFVTSESMLPADDDVTTLPDNQRLDVYVRGPGGLRLLTDVTHPNSGAFWTIGSEVAISGDGRQVAWTMRDESIVLFYPAAVEPTDTNDSDGVLDVFVAAIDDDGNGDLADGAAGSPLLASEATPGFDATSPALSADGRHVAYELDGPDLGPGSLGDVRLHDRDTLGDGLDGVDQTTVVIPAGGFPRTDSPTIGGTGADVFVAFRAAALPDDGASRIRWWRPGLADSVDVTSSAFTGGELDGTEAGSPSISGDGGKIAYDFVVVGGEGIEIDTDIPFFREQTVVVEVDPGNGGQVLTDPDGDGPDPATYGYIASQDPTDPDPTTRIGDSTTENTPSISADGRYVAFESNADNFAGVIGSGAGHVYAVDLLQHDPVDRVPVIASANVSGTPGDDGSFLPDISATGEYIAFASNAENLEFGPSYDGSANAFLMSWVVDDVVGEPVVFPDTAVGGTSSPLTLRFDTASFGPWTSSATEFLDAYVGEAHDYGFVGTCVGGVFHANDPCEIQVVFAPLQVGERVAEACVRVVQGFDSCATATVGGQAAMPDAIGPIARESLFDADDDGAADDQIVGAEGGSGDPAISADGRFVAFVTSAGLDAENDLDDTPDVYVRDRLRGTTTLISSGPDTANSDGTFFFFGSRDPSISGDGRFIAFTSEENNVIEPEGDGGADDVYVVDRGEPDATGDYVGVPTVAQQRIVSVTTVEGEGDAEIVDDAHSPSLSGDGAHIAFAVTDSFAPPPGFATFDRQVFVRDLRFGSERTAVVAFDPSVEVREAFSPAMSADGLHVALVGETELLGDDDLVTEVVYVYDRDTDFNGLLDETGGTRTVQVTSEEYTPNTDPDDSRLHPLVGTDSLQPAISGDGSTVAFSFRQFYDQHEDDTDQPVPIEDWLTALPDDTSQIVVVDRDLAGNPVASEVVSVAGPGEGVDAFEDLAENAGQCIREGNIGCFSSEPDLSDDGRYVTFLSRADNFPVQAARTLPGGSLCGVEGSCDAIVVDRDATSNGGGPQSVNAPTGEVRDPELGDFSTAIMRSVGSAPISGDGRFIAFDTGAEYLLGYDEVGPGVFEPVDDNFDSDVFVREWQPVVDPSAGLVFPETLLGTATAAQSASVSTQDFGPAPILGLALTGANPADFVILGALGCVPLPGAPPPIFGVTPVPSHGRVQLGNGCSVFVAFQPTAVGVRSANLEITTGHPFSVGGPTAVVASIPLTGGGAAPPAGQPGFGSQATFDFGSQIVTTTSPEIAIPVTNTGNTPFQITDITIGGANPGDFTIVGTDCIGFLAPGASCTVRVTFTPTAPGERTAIVVFTDTAPGGPHAIGLTGRAPLPTLILNPGVIVPGRTVQLIGANWAPNQVVTITTADANNPTVILPGSTQITANAFGGLDGSLLFFPKTASGPRIVIATGTPPTLSAFQPLLISVATVSGVDFVSRG